MIRPIPVSPLDDGGVAVRAYRLEDAGELFTALSDDRVWEHIPRRTPCDADELDEILRADLGVMRRLTFTVRSHGAAVGTTSIFHDSTDPVGVEIGATLFAPAVWGTGINDRVKRILVRELFTHGVECIRLRTDERNVRSAAAIRKLGAVELGVRQDDLVRRDGSMRRSRYFRLDRPAGGA